MANPFVASPETLEVMQSQFEKIHFSRSVIGATFETDPEFLRELLPPCFDMPDRAVGSASVGKWQMSIGGEFDIGSVDFQCKYRDIDKNASYMVVLYLESDMSVFAGRDVWGEPKKVGSANIYKCGSDIYAFAQRNGTRVIEMDVALGEDSGPSDSVNYNLGVKASPSAQGWGFQHPPVALVTENHVHHFVNIPGTGTLKFNNGEFDRLGDIPVLRTLGFSYCESKTYSVVTRMDELENPDLYLPYYYGTFFDNYPAYRYGKIFRGDR